LDFLGHPPPQYQALVIGGDDQLSMAVVGNHIQYIPDAQPHAQQPQPQRCTAGDGLDLHTLAFSGAIEGDHKILSGHALPTYSVQLHPVLKHMKSILGGDFQLQLLHRFILKLEDAFAFGADHVIMVLPEVEMFITEFAVVEAVLFCKTVVTHQIDGLFYEINIQGWILPMHQIRQLLNRNMVLRMQKNFQDRQPIIESPDAILLEQFFELVFFLLMNGMCRHGNAPAFGPKQRY
jgi:hypothetical protein